MVAVYGKKVIKVYYLYRGLVGINQVGTQQIILRQHGRYHYG